MCHPPNDTHFYSPNINADRDKWLNILQRNVYISESRMGCVGLSIMCNNVPICVCLCVLFWSPTAQAHLWTLSEIQFHPRQRCDRLTTSERRMKMKTSQFGSRVPQFNFLVLRAAPISHFDLRCQFYFFTCESIIRWNDLWANYSYVLHARVSRRWKQFEMRARRMYTSFREDHGNHSIGASWCWHKHTTHRSLKQWKKESNFL